MWHADFHSYLPKLRVVRCIRLPTLLLDNEGNNGMLHKASEPEDVKYSAVYHGDVTEVGASCPSAATVKARTIVSSGLSVAEDASQVDSAKRIRVDHDQQIRFVSNRSRATKPIMHSSGQRRIDRSVTTDQSCEYKSSNDAWVNPSITGTLGNGLAGGETSV